MVYCIPYEPDDARVRAGVRKNATTFIHLDVSRTLATVQLSLSHAGAIVTEDTIPWGCVERVVSDKKQKAPLYDRRYFSWPIVGTADDLR
jgi:hypothetical protein